MDSRQANLKLYHYTSPYAARQIAQQRTFYGGASFEDGLNVVPATGPWQPSPGYSWAGAEAGALLEFRWSGPVVQGSYIGKPADTLYDLGFHRLFIPAGTTQHLRLVGMRLHPMLQEDEWIGPPPEPRLLVWPLSSWAFTLIGLRTRYVSRWREHDLESARGILETVCTNGIPVAIRSERERPLWR